MNTFIFSAFAACVAIVICSPVDLSKSRHTGKNGGNKASHHYHLNLTKKVKNSLRQAWNETTPEAQKACEANKPIREDYKKFREELKNLTEEEQDAKIQASRWNSLSKEEQVCIFHKKEQRKEKRHYHHDCRETVDKSGNKPAEKTGKNKQVNKTQ